MRIGHGGPISSPPRSPKISPCNSTCGGTRRIMITERLGMILATPSSTGNRSCMKCGKRNVDSYMNRTAHFHLFWLSFTKTWKRTSQTVYVSTVKIRFPCHWRQNIFLFCNKGIMTPADYIRK